MTSEQEARTNIDALLKAAGWTVSDGGQTFPEYRKFHLVQTIGHRSIGAKPKNLTNELRSASWSAMPVAVSEAERDDRKVDFDPVSRRGDDARRRFRAEQIATAQSPIFTSRFAHNKHITSDRCPAY